MANTLTNVGDIAVAQKALLPFTAQLFPLKAFSTGFSPAAADKLDTVRVPVVGAKSTSVDFAGDYSTDADSTVSTVAVTLNKHKFNTVHVSAPENSATAFELLDALVASAAAQLAQDVLKDILTVVTAANFGTPGIPALAPTSFDYKKVLGLREACGTANLPATGRSMVLDSGYYTNLLADEVVARSFNLNLSAPGVTDALIRRLAGFDLYETMVIPTDHAEKLVGFATHTSAVAVAMRYLNPVAEYQQAGAVTDPETGMTFGYLRWTDTRSNRVYVTVECLYGFSATRADGLKRIVKP